MKQTAKTVFGAFELELEFDLTPEQAVALAKQSVCDGWKTSVYTASRPADVKSADYKRERESFTQAELEAACAAAKAFGCEGMKGDIAPRLMAVKPYVKGTSALREAKAKLDAAEAELAVLRAKLAAQGAA